ncbi:MAG: RICIN domain-containing protein [Mycobacterium sp.]
MRIRLVAPLLALGTTLATGSVAAPAAHAEDPIVKLVSVQNGKCLQPINGSLNRGDAVVQQACDGSADQQWTDVVVSSTAHHLVNRSSNLCLDARGTATDGTPIQQWPCNQISNELWSFGLDNNLLSSGISSGRWTHCVATPGAQDSLAMELRACDGDSSQLWDRPEG